MSDLKMGLTLEQQFNLRSFQDQLENASRAELKEFVIELSRQRMMLENACRSLMAEKLGLDHDA